MVCECSAKNRVSAIELRIYYLDVQRTASSGAELNMQDKVVVGSQDDALRGLTRFSDNEGDIIWPAWRAELKQRVAFEFGKIGNQIIEGEVKESDVDLGEVTEKINALINALIPKTRAQIQTRSDWIAKIIVPKIIKSIKFVEQYKRPIDRFKRQSILAQHPAGGKCGS